MQHQLLGGKAYNEVSITQDGIEMNTVNDTSVVDSSSTNRKGYVNLDDISENVVYAEKNIKNDYAPLSNGTPKQQQQQQQQLQQNQKPPQQQFSAQQIQQQQFQSGQMPQQNYPGLINGRAPVISQQAFTSPQQQQQYLQSQQRFGQQQIYQPQFVQPNPYAANSAFGANQANPASLTSSQCQFGMDNLSDYELQQQIQLQQKMLDDFAKAKANSTQKPQQSQQQQQQLQPKPAQQQQQLSSVQASQLKAPQQQQLQQPQQQFNSQKPAPQQQMQQQQPSVIGKMEVKCVQCMMMQRIPICSKKFQCYNCCTVQDAISQMPVYSMFLCGNCQARVLFEPGMSDYIQCTRCQIINKIGDTNDKQQASSSLPNSRNNSLPIENVQKPPILRSPVLQPQQQPPQSIFQQQMQPPLQQLPQPQQVQDQPQQKQQLYPSLQQNPQTLAPQPQASSTQQKEQDELAQIEKEFDNMIAGNGESKTQADQLEFLKKEKAELQKQLDQHKELVQSQSLFITQAQQQQQQLQQQVLLQKQQQQQQQQLTAPQQSNYNYPPPSQNQSIPSPIIYGSEMPAQGQAMSSYGTTSVYQGASISNAQL